MGKRLKIAINYQYNENWIGGSYYIQNLVFALNSLEDSEKPILFVNSPNLDALESLYKITNYPYLEVFPKPNKVQKLVNLLTRFVFNRNFYDCRKFVDAIFPSSFDRNSINDRILVNQFFRTKIFSTENLNTRIYSKDLLGNNLLEKEIFWIPDFQEKHLPHFFTKEEIIERDKIYKKIQKNAFTVVFSSFDAKKDFNTFYPQAKPKQFVMSFATHHPLENLPNKDFILKKFNISSEYFLCSNQFWKHKNHSVVLRAIALLKKEGINIHVVFTGKEHDYRNPDYFSTLKNEVTDLKIEENVKFLGFIDREDQIVLLKNCKAIVQPSLFEGWSTVIEDAIAQNVFVLASNLEVNKEQLKNYPNYFLFNPNSEYDLAEKLNENSFIRKEIDYQINRLNFANKFMEIIKFVAK